MDFLKLFSSSIANIMQFGIKGKINFLGILFVQTDKSKSLLNNGKDSLEFPSPHMIDSV